MSVSTHVIGFKPPDEKWHQMKKIWDACEESDITIPHEVIEYFDEREPDPAGVEVSITSHTWSAEMREGFEIHIDELPKDVKTIRFFNAY